MELFSVRYCRRQGDDADGPVELEDDLFPGGAALGVCEVVDFVEDDVAKIAHVFPRIQQVAQHLGCHDDDLGVPIDRHIAGHKADVVASVAFDELTIFLVRQSLDRCRVHTGCLCCECHLHREESDYRLACASRGAQQNIMALFKGARCFELEVVKLYTVGES